MLFHSSLVAHVGLVDDCGLGIFLSILGNFGSFGSYLCHLRAVHSEGRSVHTPLLDNKVEVGLACHNGASLTQRNNQLAREKNEVAIYEELYARRHGNRADNIVI